MTLAEKPTDEPKTVPSMVREPKFRVKYDANKGPQTDNNTVSSGADESVNSAGEPEINLGSIIDCSDCGARRTTIVVVDNHLCCEECNSPIGGSFNHFDSSPTSASYTQEGTEDQGAGHGPGHQLGDTLSGTQIAPGVGISSGARKQNKWSNYGSEGTPALYEARAKIRSHLSEFPRLKHTALELLDKIAWPSKEKDRTPQFKLVWQVAHPWGIAGAVAASIHAAYIVHGLQPDRKALKAIFSTEDEVNPCPKPNKILNRAVKVMTKRMGPDYSKRALNRVKRGQNLIDSVVARNPSLRPIHNKLNDDVIKMARDTNNFPDNLINPIVCLTWFVAKEYDAEHCQDGVANLNLSMQSVAEMFGFVGTSTACRQWGDLISKQLRKPKFKVGETE